MKKLSLVICTYNRVRFIGDCLESIQTQTLDTSEFEVLVINNNCTDKTMLVVDEFISNNPSIDIKQIVETNQGLSFARNRGIKESTTEIITYVDDDAILPNDFLMDVLDIMNNNPTHIGIGGKVIPKYETQRPDWFHPLLKMMVTHIDYGDRVMKCVGKKYPPGCNMTYRKDILLKSGGFNNALKWRTDDKYIFFEVQKLNDNVYYHPNLWVQHQIDAERITDKNFDNLSRKLGEEEKIRILTKNSWLLPFKMIEYFLKYIASIGLFIYFTLVGKKAVGKYVLRFRKLALQGLISQS